MQVFQNTETFFVLFNLNGIINIHQCLMFLTSDFLLLFSAFLVFFNQCPVAKSSNIIKLSN